MKKTIKFKNGSIIDLPEAKRDKNKERVINKMLRSMMTEFNKRFPIFK